MDIKTYEVSFSQTDNNVSIFAINASGTIEEVVFGDRTNPRVAEIFDGLKKGIEEGKVNLSFLEDVLIYTISDEE
jgi:hypothetical protein